MRGLLRLIFSVDQRGGSDARPVAEAVETDLNRSEPIRTGEVQFATHCPISTRRWVQPAEHAAAILEFLQGPGGRTGSIQFKELEKLHIEICAERDWEVIGWTAVGRELRTLLNDEKTYDRGKRVYRIPPVATRARLRAV